MRHCDRWVADGRALEDLLIVTDPDPKVRAAALRFLAAQHHPDAVRVLRDALSDSDPYVRANAVESLVELTGLEAEQ